MNGLFTLRHMDSYGLAAFMTTDDDCDRCEMSEDGLYNTIWNNLLHYAHSRESPAPALSLGNDSSADHL